MAATIQSQQQQQQQQQKTPPTSTSTSSSSPSNPQLKRLVYSKYRELLGSYNDKANSIIQSLPSYMVTEDRGFNLNNNNNVTINNINNGNCNGSYSGSDDNDESDNVNYGGNGSLQSRRLQSNCCDPPACIQNAMMTKDKKPFTYTPGGIDLSEIKSPRMAKRIARNAQYEGVTGAPKPSPLAQGAQYNQQPPTSSLGAQAVGMPVQVFPNGPPPPPPPASAQFLTQNSGNIPPPPPPLQQANKNLLGPQSNGIDTRKSPTPQNFEPPPFGCRPEIKIPPNPMASLKKVPRPREKNDFWIEEYRKERSASPMINNDDSSNNSYQQLREQSPLPAVNSSDAAFMKQHIPQSPNYAQQQQQQQQYQQMSPSSSIKQYTPDQQTPTRNLQNGMDFSQHNQLPQQNRIESPFQSHDSPSLQRPLSPIRVDNRQQSENSEKQQPITPIHFRSQSQPQPSSNSPPVQQQKNVGSLYIPPVSPENLNLNRQQQRQQSPPLQQHLQQHQSQRYIQANNPPTPRWMAQKAPIREMPEWVRDDTSPPPSPIRHVQAPESPAISHHQTTPITPQSPNYYTQSQQQQQQPMASNTSPMSNTNNVTSGFRIQINPKTTAASQKERIIPIQLEQTPTPTRTPGTPNFGPQPFYNVNQQYSNVTSPTPSYNNNSPNGGFNTPSNQTFATRNPNQFVDQGYNNIPARWSNQNRVQSTTSTSSSSITNNGTRIIPIAIEGQDEGPFNPNLVRGPVSSAPMVIQNDPRTLQHQHSWGGNSGQPNQSKSFKILQKITDTEEIKDTNNAINSNQRPQYIRQISNNSGGSGSTIGSGNDIIPSDQMRRMQINDQDHQNFMNRVKNQAPMQRSQLPKYVRQRSEFEQNGDQSPSSYIHPSEQQVPESKMLYTGSAIPSRSFKLLQAMTTPENAAEMEGSDVDYERMSPCQFPYSPNLHTHSHPAHLPPYWLPPPLHPGYHYPHLDSNNWYHRQSYPPSTYPPSFPPLYPYCDYDSQNFYNSVWYKYHHPASFYNLYSAGSCQIPLCKQNIKTPNIIITNSSDDEKQIDNKNDKLENENHNKSNTKEKENFLEHKQVTTETSAIDALSRKLNEISKPDLDLNISQRDDKKYVGDCRKEIQRNEDEIDTSSPIGTEKSSEIENSSDVNYYSSGEDTDSTSTDSDSKSKKSKRSHFEDIKTDRLKAVKSVTDIKIYDTDENEENVNDNKSINVSSINYRKLSEMIFGQKSDNESNNEETEEEIESSISSRSACYAPDEQDNTDIEEPDEFTDDIEVIEIEPMLSVIYEESERAGSRASTIISESEYSTTIANESSSESENNDPKMNNGNVKEVCKEDKIKQDNMTNVEDEDENSRLVTVRLPLKFSFSRSSNDENITTVIVGDSEIEDEKSTASIISKTDEDDTDNDADVSITINLPSKRKCSRNSIKSSDYVQTDDSDSEVSFSFSLPLKKDNRIVSDEAVKNLSDQCNDKFTKKNLKKNPVSGDENEFEKISVEKENYSVSVNFSKTENESEQFRNNAKIEKKFEFEDTIELSKSSTPIQKLKKEEEDDEYEEEIIEEIEWVEEEETASESESEYDSENEESLKEEDMNSTNTLLEMNENFNEMNKNEEEKEIDISHKQNDEIKENEIIKKVDKVKENYENEKKTSIDLNDNRFSQISHEDGNEIKMSVKDRIAVFETCANSQYRDNNKKSMDLLDVFPKKILSRNNSLQKSESDVEEDDSGVTSDLSKQISETDTESEGFPELRKMTRYQRAATHSRLFKLLQEESLNSEEKAQNIDEEKTVKNLQQGMNAFFVPRSREKIIHNVSITRKMNPEAIKMAETMSQRRERLSLSLTMSNSIDADNLSTSNSPSSPASPNPVISDKLVNELIQSLLLKKKSQHLRKLSMEKLQAAARKALEESFDSLELENTSINSTPAITPQEFKNETITLHNSPYTDYYDTWKNNETLTKSDDTNDLTDSLSTVAADSDDFDILPSKAFKTLQEQSVTGKRKLWAARCPRVLSSKTVNRDLAKLTQLNEQQELTTTNSNNQNLQQQQHHSRSCSVAPQSNTILNKIHFNKFKRGASLSRLTDI